MDTTTIIARSSTGGTSQRRFFRSVRLLHVSSAETTSCVEERRVSKDCGTTVGMDNRLSEQRHRNTPVVLMDANDGVGLELRAGRYRVVDCQFIAAAGARREHMAGKRLREIMEKHHMRATSAELGGATWFGDEGSSLIDYVWAPAALPLRCSGPLRRMARDNCGITPRWAWSLTTFSWQGSLRRARKRHGMLMPSWNG